VSKTSDNQNETNVFLTALPIFHQTPYERERETTTKAQRKLEKTRPFDPVARDRNPPTTFTRKNKHSWESAEMLNRKPEIHTGAQIQIEATERWRASAHENWADMLWAGKYQIRTALRAKPTRWRAESAPKPPAGPKTGS
jgi:hypothetical protein